MKTKCLMALSILLLSGSAYSAGKPPSPESVALSLIDDIAGDTWAEGGDVEHLKFESLTCDIAVRKCSLQYRIKLYKKRAVSGSCELTNIGGFYDLIVVKKNGFDLHSGIYDQLDPCISVAGN